MATVFGGVSERPQIEALRSGVDLVVATPGRLIDLMEQRVANLSGVEFVVLDEADRMLDMGFLPPIRRIMKALPHKRQTLMFSASLSREIEALTHQFQQSPKMVEIGRRANPAEAVTQFVYEVPPHLKPALLLHLLSDRNFDTVLVFSRTKHGADRIARRLESSGIKTGTIHSNRSQNQRLRALKDFKSGAVGDAISFITPEDQGPLRSLERFIGRGIVRKKAEGFDYNQPAPPRDERSRGPRVPQRRTEPRLPGNSPRGSGDAPHGQIGWSFRNASSNNR